VRNRALAKTTKREPAKLYLLRRPRPAARPELVRIAGSATVTPERILVPWQPGLGGHGSPGIAARRTGRSFSFTSGSAAFSSSFSVRYPPTSAKRVWEWMVVVADPANR
jgi:hypothetical protein